MGFGVPLPRLPVREPRNPRDFAPGKVDLPRVSAASPVEVMCTAPEAVRLRAGTPFMTSSFDTSDTSGESDTFAAPRDSAHRVLLVEDDPGDTLLFQESLSSADPDLAIDTAVSLSEAGGRLTAETECIVLDLGLPGSTGLDALVAIRTRFPDLAVVVLTGWGDEFAGTQAVATGAQDYLIKGEANGATIARSIRFAIERKRNERSSAMLIQAEMQNLEQMRLERALLGTPSLRRTDIQWSTRYTAARRGTVSGDFLDGVELPDGTIRAIVGDVAGHGPDEAALGVSLRAGWRALVLSDLEPDCVLAGLEDLLISERSTPDAYATVCDITIAPDLRSIEVRSAGHPSPVLAGIGALVDRNVRSPLGMRFGERRWAGTSFGLPPVWPWRCTPTASSRSEPQTARSCPSTMSQERSPSPSPGIESTPTCCCRGSRRAARRAGGTTWRSP